MTAICAKGTVGVDVNRALRIAAADVAFGRKARLRESPRKGPESAPKPSFDCERERPSPPKAVVSVHAD
jgi:hypothetical protein